MSEVTERFQTLGGWPYDGSLPSDRLDPEHYSKGELETYDQGFTDGWEESERYFEHSGISIAYTIVAILGFVWGVFFALLLSVWS